MKTPIRLTRHTAHALRILLEAASADGIPKNNVMKVVNQLANAGLRIRRPAAVV